ncbi:MAG: extracellular solute-binding protein [Lachnospiraceae bacterium]|nr:extracellular solute-binding protein [Lachnospiraceae bacterium]
MKAKKLTAMILTGCLALSMLAGCGNGADDAPGSQSGGDSRQGEQGSSTEGTGQETPRPETAGVTFPLEEPYEIDVFVCSGDASYNFEDTVIFKHMEEMTNVKMNVTNVGLSELLEKRNSLLQTGDYPDVFIKSSFNTGDLYEYGSEEILIPLEDLMAQYAPNYCALMDERDAWAVTTSADGHTYGFSEVNVLNINSCYMFINEQWLKNLGLDMPTDRESFYEVLKAFKEQDADGDGDPNNEIPWIAPSDLRMLENIFQYMGVNYSSSWDTMALSGDMNSIEFYPATEEYKEILAYLKKLYGEGLLYKDSWITTCDQQRAMAQTGTSIGVFAEWAPVLTMGYEKGVNEKVLEYTLMPAWEGGGFCSAIGINPSAFSITDKCERPEVMVAWVDYLYSQEGAMIAGYGYEGKHYEVIDGHVKAFTESEDYGQNMSHVSINMGGGSVSPVNAAGILPAYVDPEEDAASYKFNMDKEKAMQQYFAPWPTLIMTEEETEQNGTISADVEAYSRSYRADVITGVKDLDATWDEYISTLEGMKVRDMEANYNAAYDRYKALQ